MVVKEGWYGVGLLLIGGFHQKKNQQVFLLQEESLLGLRFEAVAVEEEQ